MSLSEQELRAMVRAAIAVQTNAAPAPAPVGLAKGVGSPSHGLLGLVGGGDSDGRCLIEPAVACTHCGYCQSLGH